MVSETSSENKINYQGQHQKPPAALAINMTRQQ